MLIRRTDTTLYLITQPDHGALTGFLAQQWGGEGFGLPGDRCGAILAADLHDCGWDELDARPLFSPALAGPYDFMNYPTRERLAGYQAGIERVAQLDPYAGLLVSLHFTGLYNGFFGWRGPVQKAAALHLLQSLPPDSQEKIRAFVAQETERQTSLQARLGATPHLRLHYLLLQVWDRLSLFAGLTAPNEITPPTLTWVTDDYNDVPTGDGRTTRPLQVTWREPGVIGLKPYPLRQPEAYFDLTVRRILTRPYQSQADLDKAWADAAPERFRINFVAVS